MGRVLFKREPQNKLEETNTTEQPDTAGVVLVVVEQERFLRTGPRRM
jgi:hypothetical protein